MRYLRRFNESNYEDVKDFCETHLAYLADKGYTIKVVETNKNALVGAVTGIEGRFHITIKYEYGISERKVEIRWSEIKDLFIPFYKILTRRYTLLRLYSCGKNYQWGKLHYEDDYKDPTKSFTCNYNNGRPHSCSLSFNNPNTIINDIPDNQIVSLILIDIV